MRLKGGRTGKRAVVCEDLELTGLMKPFDLEVLDGERVIRALGSNGSGKSHFLRLLALAAATPTRSTSRSRPSRSRRSTTRARPSSVRVRPGWFVQTHEHPELLGGCWRSCTAATSTVTAWAARRPRGSWTATSSPTPPRRASSRSRAASRRASRSCCSSSPGPRCCCSTSPPTTSTCSRPRLSEAGLESFDGTVIAVTHDRWFARGFDRLLVYGASGDVYESDGPVWDETRVQRVFAEGDHDNGRGSPSLVELVPARRRWVLTLEKGKRQQGQEVAALGVGVQGQGDRVVLAVAGVGHGDLVAGSVGPDALRGRWRR